MESIKSKLTVKQVVDGVRSGGKLSFDYLLLILTAEYVFLIGFEKNSISFQFQINTIGNVNLFISNSDFF